VEGEYFREVELKWGHPDDVVSGDGTFHHGNRFARPGRHAVYASLTEETALQEYTYGQSRTYGRFLKPNLAHVTYPIRIEAQHCVDLRPFISASRFTKFMARVLEPNEHAASQGFGNQLFRRGIQAIIYPSSVPNHMGTNIVCVLDTNPRPLVRVSNYDEILAILATLGVNRRSRG
jgi:RES domain-containing protein